MKIILEKGKNRIRDTYGKGFGKVRHIVALSRGKKTNLRLWLFGYKARGRWRNQSALLHF